MNTREVVKNLKIIGSATALLAVAGLAFGIKSGINLLRKYKREFNPETIEDLKGKILEVHYTSERNNEVKGVYLEMLCEDEIIEVHLGPAWYVDRQNIPGAGETIAVTGSRVIYRGNEILVASEVRRNGMKLILRNEAGVPSWYAWSRN